MFVLVMLGARSLKGEGVPPASIAPVLEDGNCEFKGLVPLDFSSATLI